MPDLAGIAERPADDSGMTSGTTPVHPESSDRELVERMRAGDRDAAAEFIRRYGPRLRRRIRSRLGPRLRRIFDSQDILSTLARRLDSFVLRGGLRVESEGQLWAFVLRMAENATIDKQRILRRLRAVEGEDSPVARALERRMARAGADDSDQSVGVEIERALALLDDPLDREILSMWLAGHPHTVTAQAVGLAPTAVRKRWQVIRGHLRERLSPPSAEGLSETPA